MSADTAASRGRGLLVAASFLLIGPACGAGSPTEPESPAGVTIDFADPSGSFTQHRAAIVRLIEQTLDQARTRLDVGVVAIAVSADPAGAIAGWGLGGYAPSGAAIDIAVDPSFPDLGSVLEARLPGLVAHEIHHVVRWRGPGYGVTLLEALVSEGLADHFAVELLGVPVSPWSQAFPEAQNARYLALASPLFDNVVDHGAWFYGTTTELPLWTGYTLGFRVVSAYQARTGLSAAQLVNTPAYAFRPE